MFLGHTDGLPRVGSSKELPLADPVSELEGDEDGDVSWEILYSASFEEFASSIVMYDTIIWVYISLILVLAWGVGVIMLLYLPMRCYVLSKDISSRELYVTPSEVVYKVSRPSFIPFWGVVNSERRIPLARTIDIIIEQGCLQAMFGIHTFRLESVAQGKASYVDELQIQGVYNPQLLRKVIVKEASKVIQDGSNVLKSPSTNWKAKNSHRGLNRTDVLINKMDQLTKSIKKLEGIVEKTQA